MRIAQVSPLYESVPPLFYGGTERIVAYLTDALLDLGHEVTLFASGDSRTSARLIHGCKNSLRLDKSCVDPLPHHLLMLEQVYQMADQFDIIHFHVDYIHFPLTRRLKPANVTTLHGRLNIPDLVPLYREYRDMPVISISDSQRKPLSWANWQGTVHHGIPGDLLPFNPHGGDYLAFLGRISPEKGLDAAIAIARQSGIRLKIAAKIDRENRDYYEKTIKPLLDGPLVEYVGEIGEEDKKEFLGNALALIFSINWEEPFGLVMIESMACGTPVIAFPRGAVPEVVRNGVSGYIVHDMREAIDAARKVHAMSRRGCREWFEQCFLAERMASDYVEIYQTVVDRQEKQKVKLVMK